MSSSEIKSLEYSAALKEFVPARLKHLILLNHGGGSTSVSRGIAVQMINSIEYVLEHGTSRPLQQLSICELEQAYKDGMNNILRQVEICRLLYRKVKNDLPACASPSMKYSLESFRCSFTQYQPERNAREYPCDISYQLCCQLDPKMEGIDYAYGYLSRLQSENHFISDIDQEQCIRVLNSYIKCWKSVPINLYEPIMTNTIGRIILKLPLSSLSISRKQCQMLRQKFCLMNREEINAVLMNASIDASDLFHLNHADQSYLCMSLNALSYRINALKNTDGLNRVFLQYIRN